MTKTITFVWVDFFTELRWRLLQCIGCLVGIVGLAFYFVNRLYGQLAQLLLRYLPHGQGMIATHVTAPVWVPIELTFILSLFIVMPFFFYHAWSFLASILSRPGEYGVWFLTLISSLVFYGGVVIAYCWLLPLSFEFLAHAAPVGVFVMPDVNAYLEVILKLFCLAGSVVEIPLFVVVLLWLELATVHQLREARPAIIVLSFVLGMLLTSSGVLSQVLVALPIWLLFEVGLGLAPLVPKQKNGRKYQEELI